MVNKITFIGVLLIVGLILHELVRPTKLDGEVQTIESIWYDECSRLESLMTVLTLFKGIHSNYPSNAEGLKALVENPNKKKYLEYTPLLSEIPKDNWNTEYFYEIDSQENILLISYGLDKKRGGDGNFRDIILFQGQCNYKL